MQFPSAGNFRWIVELNTLVKFSECSRIFKRLDIDNFLKLFLYISFINLFQWPLSCDSRIIQKLWKESRKYLRIQNRSHILFPFMYVFNTTNKLVAMLCYHYRFISLLFRNGMILLLDLQHIYFYEWLVGDVSIHNTPSVSFFKIMKIPSL